MEPEPPSDLLGELTRHFLRPALRQAGVSNPEQYELAWGPPSQQDLELAAFERTRREYNRAMLPTWRYVRGGRALHAFFAGGDGSLGEIPVCGIQPRRGRDGRRSMWIRGAVRARGNWLPGPSKMHGECARQVEILREVRRAEFKRAAGRREVTQP